MERLTSPMNWSTTSRTGSRAFTLIELLISIAIISLLAGLLLAALGLVTGTARRTQARKEVNEVADAIRTYFMAFNVYPPDTQDWGTVGGWDERQGTVPPDKDIDPRSIHRYLASEVRVSPRKAATQQMAIKENRFTNLQADAFGNRIGIYEDPWESPFEVDCMHMAYVNSAWRQKGWPYKGGAGRPSPEDLATFTKAFKVMSRGPDGLSSAFPFIPTLDAIEKGYMLDDLRSW
jgi:prepilin-type N-terminal cleavage/methylation domain-containing protein